MAASIYATPPPDLSSEETALSDVSNSSSTLNNRSTNNNNNNNSSNSNNNNSSSSNSNESTSSSNNSSSINKKSTTTSTNNNNNNTKNNKHQNDTATSTATTKTSAAANEATGKTTPVTAKKQKRQITDGIMENCSGEQQQQQQLQQQVHKQLKLQQQHKQRKSSKDQQLTKPNLNLQTNSNQYSSPSPQPQGAAGGGGGGGVSEEDMGGSSTNVFSCISNITDVAAAVMGGGDGTATTATATAAATTTAAAQNVNMMAAMAAAAANAAMQLQLLEALNDAAKKRRKQHNPSRLTEVGEKDSHNVEGEVGDLLNENIMTGSNATALPVVDYEEKLSKMLLPKSVEQLKETLELLQQQQQQHQQQQHQQHIENISTTTAAGSDFKGAPLHSTSPSSETASKSSPHTIEPMKNPYHTYCKECGENFETDFKLSLHMLQEHNTQNTQENLHGSFESQLGALDNAQQQKNNPSPFDVLASVKVKIERPDYDNPTTPPHTQPSLNSNSSCNPTGDSSAALQANGKDQWLNAMPGMAFPFPPEAAAAAALSAGGYLPLLGVPGFPGVDSLNRPPLRIFNPEAYCDLCNKEFCNKYFLKTHKANKHGIYDPAMPAGPESGSSGAMNQMFQLQMQQQQQQQQHQQQQLQQQHLQQQQQQKLELQQQQQQFQQQQQQQAAMAEVHQKQTAQSPPTQLNIPQQLNPASGAPAPAIYCDMCSKRFTNIFAMRRHRAKAHDQQRNSPNESQAQVPPPPQSQTQPKHDGPQSSKPVEVSSSNASAISTEPNAAVSKPFQMPEGFRQDFLLEQEEVSFTPQPRKLSPQSQQQAREANFAHEKLKRLGVLNPEAFCELCCKEYCNKYFLRTHKWKRHGIFVPPDDLKDEQFALAQKIPWPFMNMPLNLMMAANVNEKAAAAQRMLAAAAASAGLEDNGSQLPKRIKLELNEEEAYKQQEEQQGNHNEPQPQQHCQVSNLSTTPEPAQKSHIDTPSPETAMGLQNLQKLQSMIQQLNDLSGKRPMPCHICGKEMEHQYALHAHIMTEHANLMENTSAMPLILQQQQQQQHQLLKLSPTGSPGSDLRCHQCERDFATLNEFKQHIADVHLLPGSPLRDGFVTPERPINPNSAGPTRPPYTITPTSSYCEICNKELCNKYFMKTHMQRMHGIEIENGAQIGGVVCNICNKELCSKYFLRVHKHNTHGIIEEGAPLPQPRQNGLSFEAQQQQQQLLEQEMGRGLNMSPYNETKSNDASDARYYSNYTEICPICTRRFRNPKWLRGHLLSDHGPAGVEKLREIEQQFGALSKPASPTLKIPNGTGSTAPAAGGSNNSSMGPSPANLAQALQNLNAQHLLGTMPKNMLPGMFGAVAEQALQSPRFKEYQCTLCPFTTPYYAFLFIHERSHTLLNNVEEQPPKEGGHNTQDGGMHEEEKHKTSTAKSSPQSSHNNNSNSSSNNNNKQRMEPTNLCKRSAHTPETLLDTKINEPPTSNESSNDTELPKRRENSNAFDQLEEEDNEQFKTVPSAATSPIIPTSTTPPAGLTQDMLEGIANKMGKPACYAMPKDNTRAACEQQMQAFIMEARGTGDVEDNSNRFVPAIIYLPVNARISEPMTMSFKLTPI